MEFASEEQPPAERESETEEEEIEGEARTPRTPRKPKAPKVLTDYNLSEANLSLADFMKQKNPTDMMDKCAVVAVWYKEQFNITDIDISRIYTAFKHLGIESQLPTDVLTPLKNLTYLKSRGWFEKVDGKKNTFRIIWIGEDAVSKMGSGTSK